MLIIFVIIIIITMCAFPPLGKHLVALVISQVLLPRKYVGSKLPGHISGEGKQFSASVDDFIWIDR